MKKGFLKLSVLFVALFIGIIGVNADITPVSSTCNLNNPTETTDSSCDLQFDIGGSSTIENGQTFQVTFGSAKNIQNNEIKLDVEGNDWTIDGEKTKTINLTDGSVTVTVKYVGTETLSSSVVKFATGSYKKVTAGDACGFNYGFPPYCRTDGTIYYDSKGELTDEAGYYKDCFSCLTPDKSSDGKYHGLDGKVTDEAGYNKDCTNTCKKENDKYYCKKGNECTKEEYDNECQPNTKTGSFIPYAGIIAGVVLIITATVMVKKQTKLRRL